MFLSNKYSKWYFQIIKNASDLIRFGYTEKHHIIPKSLGGTNSKENLVRLTAREYFIAHHLLTKMTEGSDKKKMQKALWILRHTKTGTKLTSKQFESLRIDFAKSVSEFWKGRKMSPEHYSNLLKGQKISRDRGVKYGGMRNDEHRKTMIESNKRRVGMKYKSHTQGSHVGAKNGRCKVWTLEHKGETVTVHNNLRIWCKERGLVDSTLKIKSAQDEFYKDTKIISSS